MTIGEMKAQFPNEWVLIGDARTDEDRQILGGTVLWHGEDRKEMYDKSAELGPKLSAVRCFQEPLEDEHFWLTPFFIEGVDDAEAGPAVPER